MSQLYYRVKWFSSAEQAYWWSFAGYNCQYAKQAQIRATMDPVMIKLIGCSLGPGDDDWNSIKEAHMFDILMAKYQYCPEFAWKFNMTHDVVFKFNSPDPYWGARGGPNRLGCLLAQVKECQAALAAHYMNYTSDYKRSKANLHKSGSD